MPTDSVSCVAFLGPISLSGYGPVTGSTIIISDDFWFHSIFTVTIIPMLGESLVTTAWRVLRLRMEETASRYGG
jgi:hypothetical protein